MHVLFATKITLRCFYSRELIGLVTSDDIGPYRPLCLTLV